jgi:hypothetical protein
LGSYSGSPFLTQLSNNPSSSQSSLATHDESHGLNAPENGGIASPDTSAAMDTSEDVHTVDESMMDTVHTRNGTTNLTGTEEAAYTERLAKLKIILSGETPIQLT